MYTQMRWRKSVQSFNLMSYIIGVSQQNKRGRRSLQIVQLAQVMTQLAYRYSTCSAYGNNVSVCVSLIL